MALLALQLGGCGGAAEWRGLAKVGLVLPFHGPDPAGAMAIHVAVRQRLIDLNRDGGLAGRRLELVSLDDQADPVVGRRRVDELARDSLVVAVVAPRASGLAEAVRRAGLRFVPIESAAEARQAVDAALAGVSRR